MNNEPKTKYVVVDKTIKELEDFSKISGAYNEKIYTRDIVHEDMDIVQKNIQLQNKWNAQVTNAIRFNQDALYDNAREIVYEELKNGTRENISAKLKQRLMDTHVRAVIEMYDRPEGQVGASCEIEYGKKNENDTYIEDEKAMDEALKKVRVKVYNWQRNDDDTNTYVMVEKVEVSIYTYAYQSASDDIDRIVKRFIREEFTYCLKNDNVIVPEEYIEKGEAGIKEWRELKASKNKNNNMEKRMLRDMVRKKKDKNISQMKRLMWRFPRGQEDPNNVDWSIPYLNLYGSGNTAMAKKLVTQILGEQTDAELLNMTEEEVDKKFKEYWKEALRRAIEQIDNVETYEKE